MEAYLAKLPRVVENLCIMLEDRGFHKPDYSEETDLVGCALRRGVSIGESLTCRVRHKTEDRVLQIVVLDPVVDALRGKEVMTSKPQIFGAAALAEGAEAIVLIFAKLSPDAKKEAFRLRRTVTVFFAPQMLAIPLSKHVMVPKHSALTEDEARCVLAQFKVERSQLPVIKYLDPVRQWYGWPKGTLIRIDRPGGVISWRVVK